MNWRQYLQLGVGHRERSTLQIEMKNHSSEQSMPKAAVSHKFLVRRDPVAGMQYPHVTYGDAGHCTSYTNIRRKEIRTRTVALILSIPRQDNQSLIVGQTVLNCSRYRLVLFDVFCAAFGIEG